MAKGTSFIRIHMDAKACLKSLSDLEKKQYPYAYAVALTRTAQMAQGIIQTETKGIFRLHSDFIPKSVRIKPASKADIKNFNLAEATVHTTEKTAFMTSHETGEDKTPRNTALSIPVPGFKASRITGMGGIRKGQRPKALLDSGRAFVKDGKVFIRKPKRQGLIFAYFFKPRARINKTWDFHKTVEEVVVSQFEGIFSKTLESAMKGGIV